MIDTKIIRLIHKEKEEIKLKQRQLLVNYGFGKNSRDIDKQTSEAFFKMADEKESNSDYDTFIELEKEYVSCNQKLINMGIAHREIMESR